MKQFLMAAALALTATTASALEVTIAGTDSIYGAGLGGNGVSTAPQQVDFALASGTFVTVDYIAGATGCCGLNTTPTAGADGAIFLDAGETLIRGTNNISGIRAPSQMFLAGVFVRSYTPTTQDPRPLDINFISDGIDFTTLFPDMSQAFFIGDGLTGTGTGQVQKFYAPEGADRLLLGFVDGGSFRGLPSFYGDNPGSLTMAVNVVSPAAVPLPAGLPLLLAGLGGFALLRRKS